MLFRSSKQIRDLEEEIRFPIFDRGRDGVRVTLAGEMVVAYAKETLRVRDELVAMARAVYLGEVPPLRLGFSSFVSGHLLQSLRETYCGMFPGCEIKLTGGDPAQVLQRINQRALDCAILPMPIESDIHHVQQISQSPLVVCLRSDVLSLSSCNSTFMRSRTESKSFVILNSNRLRMPG